MIEHDAAADLRRRVHVYREQLGYPALHKQRHRLAAPGPQPVGDTVALQRMEAFVEQEGVEIGMGFAVADVPGSQVHDEFFYDNDERRFTRGSNNAGGTEGGISNGEPVIARAAMKPIATLMKPLSSVNMNTKDGVPAFAERSDVCAVPAAAVIGEAMVGIAIAESFCEKFGSDSIEEMRAHFDAYKKMVDDRAALKSPQPESTT